jgi:hypothetical protein
MLGSRWWMRLGLLAIVALFAIPTPPVSAAAQAEALINVYSGKCLDVVGASTADGANVQQFRCHLGANQQWKIIPNLGPTLEPDGTYLIINQNSGKCLDVVGASTADGANVQQYTCHRQANQRWIIRYDQHRGDRATYRFVNVRSGKCLEVAGSSTADGANVRQSTCDGAYNQRWLRSANA